MLVKSVLRKLYHVLILGMKQVHLGHFGILNTAKIAKTNLHNYTTLLTCGSTPRTPLTVH